MILLQVHVRCLAALSSEGERPRAVHVDRVALRLPLQRMEVKTRHRKGREVRCVRHRIEPNADTLLKISANLSRLPGLEKPLEALVPEAPDHAFRCSIIGDRLSIVMLRLPEPVVPG